MLQCCCLIFSDLDKTRFAPRRCRLRTAALTSSEQLGQGNEARERQRIAARTQRKRGEVSLSAAPRQIPPHLTEAHSQPSHRPPSRNALLQAGQFALFLPNSTQAPTATLRCASPAQHPGSSGAELPSGGNNSKGTAPACTSETATALPGSPSPAPLPLPGRAGTRAQHRGCPRGSSSSSSLAARAQSTALPAPLPLLEAHLGVSCPTPMALVGQVPVVAARSEAGTSGGLQRYWCFSGGAEHLSLLSVAPVPCLDLSGCLSHPVFKSKRTFCLLLQQEARMQSSPWHPVAGFPRLRALLPGVSSTVRTPARGQSCCAQKPRLFCL